MALSTQLSHQSNGIRQLKILRNMLCISLEREEGGGRGRHITSSLPKVPNVAYVGL